jgi:nucleoside-diphosphate-sugar epimerase
MKILVTGATGFTGRPLVSRLAARHEVYALARRPEQTAWEPQVRAVAADLAGPLAPDRLPASVDAIVHLAIAKVPYPESAVEMFAVNTGATLQLLDYGRRAGARHFVLISSGDVYGRRTGFCKETDPAAPASFYAVTKYAAEMLARSYAEYLTPCVLRLFRPYGPGQVNRLIPNLARRMREGRPPQVPPPGRGRQTPVYLADVLTALERVLEARCGGVLNVAGDEVVSMRELAEAVGRALGVRPVFEGHADDPGDAMGDNARMHQVLGRWPLLGLAEGLARTFGNEGGGDGGRAAA